VLDLGALLFGQLTSLGIRPIEDRGSLVGKFPQASLGLLWIHVAHSFPALGGASYARPLVLVPESSAPGGVGR
jgi:hypothetical protein